MNHSTTSSPRSIYASLYRAIALTTLLSMLLGGLVLVQPASAQSAATVTSDLNLRSGPSTNDAIISVMPAGAAVTITGDATNGYYPLTFQGTQGYGHSDWISYGGSSGSGSTASATGTAYVIDGSLNLRSGPSTGNSVVTVMPDGAQVSLTGESSGGFLSVTYNGSAGWAFADYLSSSAGSGDTSGSGSTAVGDTVVSTMRTTTRLNMRSGPGTNYGIITTLVNGATVEIMGSAQGGFYPVRYGGNKGWMSGDYLTTEGAGTPGPASEAPVQNPGAPGSVAVGDTVIGTMTVSTGLNLRQGPGTNYNAILVMPGGASVSVMGSPQNGFYPVTFHGSKGWASGDFLTSGAVSVPDSGDTTYTRDEIIQIIYAAADRYGQPRADMLRVAQCESVLDPNAVNPASGVSGLFQFMPGTWATTPYANEDIFDPVANANAAAWMWSVGRRNEWHCQ